MAITYTGTATTQVAHRVRCVHCGVDYVYEMSVSNTAEADTHNLSAEAAQEKAKADAAINLAKRLANPAHIYATVPCPACSRYQPHMYETVSRERYGKLGCIGCAAAVPGLLTVVAMVALGSSVDQSKAIQFIIAGAVVFVVGIGVSRWTKYRIEKGDPNDNNLGGRQRKAKERAMSPAAHEERQAERLRAAYSASTSRTPDPGAPPVRTVEWWADQDVLAAGGTIAVRLGGTDAATVVVPAGTPAGTACEVRVGDRVVPGLKARVSPFFVRHDELPRGGVRP